LPGDALDRVPDAVRAGVLALELDQPSGGSAA
jgi:hypothetical protein